MLETQSLIQRKAPQTRACPQRLQRCAATAASLVRDGSSSPAKGPASAPSTRAAHVGVWKPWRRRDSAACSASRALGGVLGADRSVKGRTRLARVPGWHSRKAPITSAGCLVRCMTMLPFGG